MNRKQLPYRLDGGCKRNHTEQRETFYDTRRISNTQIETTIESISKSDGIYNPKKAWKQYAKERLDDWQREIMSDSVRCCFDVPELKYSRKRAINGTGYGWLNVVNPKGLFSIKIP